MFHKYSPTRSAVFQAIETAIMHFNAMQCLINGHSKSNDTYQLMYRARVHIENKKEVRNYDAND